MKEGNASPGVGIGIANGNVTAVDGMVWETFQKSFNQVQAILDQNRVLIREINQNQESKIPQNLTRNVGLIRELNNNIARVVELYATLSTDFVQAMASEKSTDGGGLGLKMSGTAALPTTVNGNGKATATATTSTTKTKISGVVNGSSTPSFSGLKKPRHE